MSTFEFIDSDTEESFDILVQVGFEKPLDVNDTLRVLQIILEPVTSKIASVLLEQLISLHIDQTGVTIRFRYATNPTSLLVAHQQTSEYTSRLKVQFIYYLFARIDAQYTLGDIPFPSSFRGFLTLPDDININL
ncbi:MAG: hypothetical protein KF716_27945 [Anaerolineae bacterium]|nr:hypothetical protein [Anaerolineae bacterium]